MFRPKKNFDRFKRSAARLGLPVSRPERVLFDWQVADKPERVG